MGNGEIGESEKVLFRYYFVIIHAWHYDKFTEEQTVSRPLEDSLPASRRSYAVTSRRDK